MTNHKIASNVMENISSLLKDKGFSDNKRKALVVLNGSNLNSFDQFEYVMNLKKEGYEIALAFSFMAERILDTKKIIDSLKPIKVYKEDDIFHLKTIINEYSIVVGVNITMNTLSKVSLGMIDSFIANIIWSFLYSGKKVYLSFYSVRNYMGNPPKSKAISHVIEKHIESVLAMGAIELTSNMKVEPNKELKIDGSLENKNLITERDISKLDKSKKVLILDKKTIVTPLARDKAKQLGIKIEKP